MNIFILEDDLNQRQRIEKIINQIISSNKFKCKKLFITGKPDELIKKITEIGNHQIYFLDIEIKNYEKKGLEVAQIIRQKDPYGTIVFITTHSEFAPLTFSYKVSALDFIAKDQNDVDFSNRITSCLNFVEENQVKEIATDVFIFESNNKQFQIPFSEILYFETSTQPHRVFLVTKKQRIEFYSNLATIEKLDDRLYKSHKSFVVNLANISKLDKSSNILHFDNGESCFVSRRKLKNIIELVSVSK
ncbi:response regulator transcription factor [Listeria cossartiae]|uniref:response regulator transcription factor n=1 Tax=Listeria cossartiae TaxID=2838249 RepID=UPI00162A7C82|nr:response regulator transcription factor [Listeria cossartiae]MBC1543111.1 response regulator transcription factor [Listeria cossartiae subsp. cossartiae]MBC1550143.1 response regulator transcription factor [Listeria cossartiae subsp. cossartiae]MBC1567887.1 response regulator transcription factor [Listeria cossartiae subsp. cossartiae]MBC1571042.1 response regulator transcription factor [Listeria cossartiae subsp. cossartiae]